MKKIISIVSVLMIGLMLMVPKVKAADPADIYLFYGDGCAFCKAASEFFDSIEEEYGDMFNLTKIEVWGSESNSKVMHEVAEEYGEEVTGVPYIVIGEKTFKGYSIDGAWDEDIKEAIKTLYNAENRVDKVENKNFTASSGETSVEESSNTGVYAALAVIVLALGGLLLYTRNQTVEDNATKDEEIKEEVEEEKKDVEEKKVVSKKPTTTKTTSKKTTSSSSKKQSQKKVNSNTTKKTTAKKTNKK